MPTKKRLTAHDSNKDRRYGIDLLRYAAKLFDSCNETINQRFTAEELLKIASACEQSEWDFLPDQWTDRQLRDAIRGIVPRWRETEDDYVPDYSPPTKKAS